MTPVYCKSVKVEQKTECLKTFFNYVIKLGGIIQENDFFE